MGVGFGTRDLKRNDLEAWLGQVLVPVEPAERFVTRLRGRLVELRGARPTRGWTLLLAGLGLAIGAAIWLGAAVRLILALLAIGGLIERRRRSSRLDRSGTV
jgi:hypothetical protein